MHHLLRAEAVLEDALGALHRFGGIAAAQAEVERNVRVLLALQVFQVRKRAGGLELIVHDRLGGHRLDFVVHRRKLFVFGGDEVHRLLRHMRIGGEHHRDRLADVAHLVHGEHRLVVERRAVERIRQDRLYLGCRDDAVHTGERFRGTGVDVLDAAVRDARAENLAVEHARQPQVMDVLGPARDLEPRLEARYRAADLRRLSGVRCALHRLPVLRTREGVASYTQPSRADRYRSSGLLPLPPRRSASAGRSPR